MMIIPLFGWFSITTQSLEWIENEHFPLANYTLLKWTSKILSYIPSIRMNYWWSSRRRKTVPLEHGWLLYVIPYQQVKEPQYLSNIYSKLTHDSFTVYTKDSERWTWTFDSSFSGMVANIFPNSFRATRNPPVGRLYKTDPPGRVTTPGGRLAQEMEGVKIE